MVSIKNFQSFLSRPKNSRNTTGSIDNIDKILLIIGDFASFVLSLSSTEHTNRFTDHILGYNNRFDTDKIG